MHTATVRNCEFFYQQTGTGPDIVWGHGLSSSMADEDELGFVDWRKLDGDYRVLRYDARGHGETGSTGDLEGYSWHNLALDQLALAEALGIERYVAAGASMGAATALHAAVLSPRRVRALLLVIPPTGWDTRSAQVGMYARMADLIEAKKHAELLAGSRQLPPPDPVAQEPAWTERFERKLSAVDPVRLARVFRGAGRADLPSPEAIAAIRAPTLILGWTGDAAHPIATSARLQELIPHAELAIATTRAGMTSWTGRIADFLERSLSGR